MKSFARYLNCKGVTTMANEFKVVRMPFETLEAFLNSIEYEYEEYYIYQILTEVFKNKSFVVVILRKKVI